MSESCQNPLGCPPPGFTLTGALQDRCCDVLDESYNHHMTMESLPLKFNIKVNSVRQKSMLLINV